MKIPQFVSLDGLSKRQVKNDFFAALVVTAIAIPESLGFALILGLPAETGLYCALLAPAVFALLTSSKHLVVGADSATAALIASGAATFAAVDSPERVNAIAVLCIVTGIILIAMSIARFGFLADLISKPVFLGFLAGIGIQLMIGRLPDMLGLEIDDTTTIQKIAGLFDQIGQISPTTVSFTTVIILAMLLARKFHKPASLVAIVIAVALTYFLRLEEKGLAVIGAIPSGLPPIALPSFSFDLIKNVLPSAVAMAVVILAQSSTVIRSTAVRFDEKIDDNRDLNALGFANIASAITGGFAINGSPPRTTAAELNGGRTQLVNVFMSIFVGLILLFFASSLQYVPTAALATVVFVIGLHLMNIGQLKKIVRTRRAEFLVAMIALLSVALFGVLYGVMIAVATSIIEKLGRQYKPNDEVLLRDGKLAPWAEDRIDKHHKHRSSPPGVLAYWFGGSIFFENTNYFTSRVHSAIAKAKQPVECFIIDAGSISDIDYTAAEAIKHLCHKLNSDDIRLVLAHVPPELSKLLDRYDLVDVIGRQNIYPSLTEAIFKHPQSKRSAIEMVKRLAPPDGQYIVIGGGVMEVLGLRETNDLDIVVSHKAYKHYKNKGWKEFIQDDGKRLLSHHGYQIMETYVGKNINQLRARSFSIQGVPFMAVQDLIAAKQRIGRNKDLRDIALLKSYLQKSTL